jgi:hypothetical protein
MGMTIEQEEILLTHLKSQEQLHKWCNETTYNKDSYPIVTTLNLKTEEDWSRALKNKRTRIDIQDDWDARHRQQTLDSIDNL